MVTRGKAYSSRTRQVRTSSKCGSRGTLGRRRRISWIRKLALPDCSALDGLQGGTGGLDRWWHREVRNCRRQPCTSHPIRQPEISTIPFIRGSTAAGSWRRVQTEQFTPLQCRSMRRPLCMKGVSPRHSGGDESKLGELAD
jgi:hypothetical protein